MSRGRDDLVDGFWRRAPDRVAELTDAWLKIEAGDRNELAPLRRTLHTFKGEAHMLGLAEPGSLLEKCERAVDLVLAREADPEIAGDALLGGFEALGLLSSTVDSNERFDLSDVMDALEAAIAALTKQGSADSTANRDRAAITETKTQDRPRTTKSRPKPKEESTEAQEKASRSRALDAGGVLPLFHELRRLHAEQALLLPELSELQRRVRALLAEIRPDESPEMLRERIVKTLGYGTEIERRMSALRETWSANEFTTALTLDQLEDVLQRASLVSTDALATQVHRVAKSTAQTVSKSVNVVVEGDAMLDAAVEKRLSPSLIHLVRNAVDHGIEDAETRRERGKPVKGTIKVTLTQTESSVRADVEDDGGGIDFDGLRRKLSASGEHEGEMSDAEVLDLIFSHGVTVRDEADEISGRGVGLDVVSREIRAIGGNITVESTQGLGTRFSLSVPVTLRADVAVPVVSVRQTYAVPARAVLGIRHVEEVLGSPDGPQLRLDDELVPLFSLSAITHRRGQPEAMDIAVILSHRTGPFALTVEEAQNPRPVTFTHLSDLPFRSPLVRGVSVLADGGTMQLLDVDELRRVADVTRSSSEGRAQNPT